MNITFLGATKTVTGSNFLVEGAAVKPPCYYIIESHASANLSVFILEATKELVGFAAY